MSSDATDTVTFKPHSRGLLACISLLILMPAIAGFFIDHQLRADWEKRELAALPKPVQSQTAQAYFSDLDAFINDHIGFARQFNQTYRKLQFYVFRDPPLPNVDIGTNGFVFLNAHSPDQPYGKMRKLCQPRKQELNSTINSVTILGEAANAAHTRLSIAVVPTKPLLYPDQLPETVPAHLRNACHTISTAETSAGLLRQVAPGHPWLVHYPIKEMISMRDNPAFYPPGNYHANSRINHEFARGLLKMLNIFPGPSFSDGARLGRVFADIRMMGFIRKIDAWQYPYQSYKIRRSPREPEWVRDAYPNVRDFNLFRSDNPASDRVALVLSNSFGAFLTPHLAPGFKTLYHININHLSKDNSVDFLMHAIDNVRPDELIYLVHDGGLPNHNLIYLAEGLSAEADETR